MLLVSIVSKDIVLSISSSIKPAPIFQDINRAAVGSLNRLIDYSLSRLYNPQQTHTIIFIAAGLKTAVIRAAPNDKPAYICIDISITYSIYNSLNSTNTNNYIIPNRNIITNHNYRLSSVFMRSINYGNNKPIKRG